jgi:NTP pyrophosphatase (non-canonical NTP hydrolase)
MTEQLNYKKVTRQVAEWSRENFGEQDPLNCLSGASEELGELVEAREMQDKEAERDSVGDIFIYLCDYAFRSDAETVPQHLSGVSGRIHDGKQIENLVSDLGRLHRAELKNKQGIREHEWRTSSGAKSAALNDAFVHLRAYCMDNDWELDAVVDETLDEVLDRDW